MPLHRVIMSDGTPGWKWGQHGKAYKSKKKAIQQMKAIFANGYHKHATLLTQDYKMTLTDRIEKQLSNIHMSKTASQHPVAMKATDEAIKQKASRQDLLTRTISRELDAVHMSKVASMVKSAQDKKQQDGPIKEGLNKILQGTNDTINATKNAVSGKLGQWGVKQKLEQLKKHISEHKLAYGIGAAGVGAAGIAGLIAYLKNKKEGKKQKEQA